jgi:CubicO group peptidase (beta-lactamase class C family)
MRSKRTFVSQIAVSQIALAKFALNVAAQVLLLGCAAAAQHPIVEELGVQTDRIVRDEMQKQQIPAVTIAIAQNGRIVYSKAFGVADVENSVPATPETLIRTGSIAKSMTAVAAMTLVESGKLDLDAPVQKYCPAFPQKQWTITTRQLLNHTSGIRHYKESEMDSPKHFSSMSDGFAIFGADALLFEPGTKYNYSTYGYTVAGCVIEGASGEKYFDYLREHVLVPAGMTHTFVDDARAIVPHRAHGYHLAEGHLENAGLMDSSYKIPGGGLVSNAEDCARFAMALMDGKIVKAKTLVTIWSPSGAPTLGDGKPSTYALGFAVLTIEGQQWVANTGGQQGTNTEIEIIPEKKFAVAVFANDDSAQAAEIAKQVLDLYHMRRPR